MTSQTCTFCSTTGITTGTCPTCGAQYGYRDNRSIVRGKIGWLVLMAVTAGFAIALLRLASIIWLWYYFYPLSITGSLLVLGFLILLAGLIRGPKWYPA